MVKTKDYDDNPLSINNNSESSFQNESNLSKRQIFNQIYIWAQNSIVDFNNLLYNNELISQHMLGVYKILESIDIDINITQACSLFLLTPYLEEVSAENKQKLQQICNTDAMHLASCVFKVLQTTQQFTVNTERINNKMQHNETYEILRNMLLACAQDIRAIVIMLASQLQTLRYHSWNKTNPPMMWVKDVLTLYAPLANRLGIWQLKWELEDLSFRFAESENYRKIAALLDEKRIERENFIESMKQKLIDSMQIANIKADISGRPKHIYSIWKKMHNKNLLFNNLYDVRAFRIIVDSIKDCYAVLGIVHILWNPIPKEFDDYISHPKSNGYKSLHTVVIADDGRAIEIQIRTYDMHKQAEFGIAAHWRYKESDGKDNSNIYSGNASYEEKIAALRQLLEWKEEYNPNHDISAEQRWDKVTHWVDDNIYVFTPQAKVIMLPAGSTVLDFAYHIHTNIGHRCRGAKIDGKIVPLYTIVHNSQTVEVITVKDGGPSKNWLQNNPPYLISTRAKSKVRAWFNAMEIQDTLNKGRAILDKILHKEKRSSINIEDLAHHCKFKNSNELILNLAKELFSIKNIEDIIHKFYSDKNNNDLENTSLQLKPQDLFSLKDKQYSNNYNDVTVMGLSGISVQIAKCCKPIPSDNIIGVVTRTKGITVHRTECHEFKKIKNSNPDKIISTEWVQNITKKYLVELVIIAHDRQGLLRDISYIFSREKINVITVQTRTKDNEAKMLFCIEISHADKLKQAITMLGNINHIISINRKS